MKASFPYHHSIASNYSQERQSLIKLVHELEEETEGLSSMVVTSHLCHHHHDIMKATHTVLCKRKLLFTDIPNLRKLPKVGVLLKCMCACGPACMPVLMCTCESSHPFPASFCC